MRVAARAVASALARMVARGCSPQGAWEIEAATARRGERRNRSNRRRTSRGHIQHPARRRRNRYLTRTGSWYPEDRIALGWSEAALVVTRAVAVTAAAAGVAAGGEAVHGAQVVVQAPVAWAAVACAAAAATETQKTWTWRRSPSRRWHSYDPRSSE